MLHKFRYRILVPLVAVWLAFTVIGVVARIMVRHRLSSAVNSSFEVANSGRALDLLFSSLQDAETGERGFLLTGNESYLQPFNDAEKSLPGQFSDLATMIAGDKFLQTNLLNLRGLAEVKMTELREAVRLRRTNDMAAAMTQVNSGKGKETMDAIRHVTAQMQAHRLAVFSQVGTATRRQLRETQALELAVGFLGIGAGLFALYLIWLGDRQEFANQKLLEGKLRAERTAMEKSAFLANISHEIRTPMNAILGFSELLEGESLPVRSAQYVRSIRQSGKSLLQLVSDVLDLSKLEAGKLELQLEPTDVREVCNFLQTLFAQQAAAKSLKLYFEIPEMPRALLLDRLRLRQILVNLIGNALKFTDRGHVRTRIEWSEQSTERSRGSLVFHIEDTGVGIAPEKQEEIFKAFVQSGSSRAAQNQGTGLGLNIVQRLAGIMGGAVTLDSSPGQGSVFHLRFPEVAVSARLPVSDLVESAEHSDLDDFEPATLLVVDDNEANRHLVAAMFADTHHTVRLAAGGREALDSITQLKPSIVLLDMRMPAMDGLAVLAAIRKTAGLELLPVVAVTASSPIKDKQGIRNRFNGYIRKPFSRRTLYQELAQILPRTAQKKSRPEPAPKPAPHPATGMARKADDWNLLVAQLRAMQTSEWEGLRESLAINQTQAFARKLYGLAQATRCHPLATYAEQLTAHAQMYAVGDLERQLSEFPVLVQTIEKFSLTTPDE